MHGYPAWFGLLFYTETWYAVGVVIGLVLAAAFYKGK